MVWILFDGSMASPLSSTAAKAGEKPLRSRAAPEHRSAICGIGFPVPQYTIAAQMESYAKGAPEYDEFGPFAGGYLVLLRNQRGVRAVFRYLARAARADGCALFHCTGGMDRTGAIAMLLMGLAEAPRESLMLDFGYSFASADTVERLVWDGAANEADEALFELIESIDVARNALVERYGSVRGYLESCGIPARDLNRILRWMVARAIG